MGALLEHVCQYVTCRLVNDGVLTGGCVCEWVYLSSPPFVPLYGISPVRRSSWVGATQSHRLVREASLGGGRCSGDDL